MNERVIRMTIVSFASLMLVATVLSVRLSTVQPPYGTRVYGSGHVWRGHTAVFRVLLLDPDGYTALTADHMRVAIHDSRGERLHIDAIPSELTTLRIPIPTDLEAYATLILDVERPEGQDHVTITLRSDATPPTTARLTPWRETLDPHLPYRPTPWALGAYPAGGKLVGGLDNRIFLRATHDDKPVAAATLTCDAARLNAQTDTAGIVSFRYRPTAHGGPLRIIFDHDPNRTVDLPLDVRAGQLTLGVMGNAHIAAGTDPAFGVTTLPFKDTVYVDLWVGDAWVASVQGQPDHGVFNERLIVPNDAHGFVRWSAYRNYDRPDDTAAHVWKWAHPPASPWITDAATTLKGLPGNDVTVAALEDTAASPEAAEGLLTLALSRLTPADPGPPLLASTGEARRAVFEGIKAAERGRIHTFLLGVMASGLALACLLLWRHHIRTRVAVGEALKEAEQAGIDIEPGTAKKLENRQLASALVLALITLTLAGYGLFVLLNRMRWD